MTFNLKTEAEICAAFHVTPDQIDAASRVIDLVTGNVFYQVKSASEPGRVYEVRYHAQFKRFSCTCKAGEAGFGCWHRRAALAVQYEYRQAENLQARMEAGDRAAMVEAEWLEHRKRFDRHFREVDKLLGQ